MLEGIRMVVLEGWDESQGALYFEVMGNLHGIEII